MTYKKRSRKRGGNNAPAAGPAAGPAAIPGANPTNTPVPAAGSGTNAAKAPAPAPAAEKEELTFEQKAQLEKLKKVQCYKKLQEEISLDPVIAASKELEEYYIHNPALHQPHKVRLGGVRRNAFPVGTVTPHARA